MADRLSWWVIPGALVVLTRVVTLDASPDPGTRSTVREATHAEDVVVLQDAAGRRSKPVAWSTLTATALVVQLPATTAGNTVQVRVWRHGARSGAQSRSAPWLQVEVAVREDGTVPIAGLAAGRYDVRVSAAAGQQFEAADVAAPGSCEPSLHAAAAPVR